jgi:hypothetical protein
VADGRTAHVYEIHARHYDTLPLPYLHAYWSILTEEEGMHGIQVQAIRRYSAAAQPGYLQAYLCARVHVLRWIEDRIGELGRNRQIVKRPLDLSQLSAFDLDAASVARANRDLMRLEHHLARGAWLAARLGPPGERLPAGRTIPVKRVRAIAENTVAVDLNLAPYGLTAADLEPVCTIAVGDWVRLARRDAPQTYGQLTTGGKTGIVRALDWAAGTMVIDVLWQPQATRYRLQSAGVTRQDAQDGTIIYSFATVNESPSDYGADRVEAALGQGTPTPLYAWFDHTALAIPPVARLTPAGARRARCLPERPVPSWWRAPGRGAGRGGAGLGRDTPVARAGAAGHRENRHCGGGHRRRGRDAAGGRARARVRTHPHGG